VEALDIFASVNLLFSLMAAIFYSVLLLMTGPEKRDAWSFTAALLCWVFVFTPELSPLRFTAFYPAQTDSMNVFLMCLVTLLAFSRHGTLTRWEAITAVVIFVTGTLNRENFGVTALLFPLLGLQYDRGKLVFHAQKRNLVLGLLALIGSIAGLSITLSVFGVNPFSGKEHVVAQYFKSVTLAQSISAIAITYGAFVLTWLASLLSPREVSSRLPPGSVGGILFVLLTTVLYLSSGNNPERYLFWNAPILGLLTLPVMTILLFQKRYLTVLFVLLYFLATSNVIHPISPEYPGGCNIMDIIDGKGIQLMHFSYNCSQIDTALFSLYFVAACFCVIPLGLIEHKLLSRKPSYSAES
jgi:hypothetical protein